MECIIIFILGLVTVIILTNSYFMQDKRVISDIESKISNMTKERCAVIKKEIEEEIKIAFLYRKVNKNTRDRLLKEVRDKYVGLFD